MEKTAEQNRRALRLNKVKHPPWINSIMEEREMKKTTGRIMLTAATLLALVLAGESGDGIAADADWLREWAAQELYAFRLNG